MTATAQPTTRHRDGAKGRSARSSPSLHMPVPARIGIWAAITAAVLFFGFPIFWMVISSLKPPLALTGAPSLIFQPGLDSYRRLFTDLPVLPMIGNSLLVAACSTGLAVVFGAAAAYGLASRGMKGRQPVSLWLLFLRAVPPVVMFVPLYVLFQRAGLLNTHVGLVLAYLTFQLPFAILLMVSFFDELPPEIGEAAMLDGCSMLQRFRHIELPLILPAIATTAVFCALFSWNEYIIAMIMSGPDTATLPLGVNRYIFVMGANNNPMGPLTALGTLIILPAFLCTAVLQRFLVRGMTLGAVK